MHYLKMIIFVLLLVSIGPAAEAQVSLTEYTTGSPFTNLTAVQITAQGKAYIGSTCLAENKSSCLNVMKTMNQGNSWNYVSSCSIDPGDPFDHVIKMCFITANFGFALVDELRVGTHETKILVTHDSGFTWVPTYHYPVDGDYDQLNDMAFFDANTGLAIGQRDNLSKGTLVHTDNGGDKWTENFTSFPDLQLLSLDIVNDSTAYMAGQDGSWINKDIHWYLYKTSDQGLSWEQVFTDTVAYPSDYNSEVSEIDFINKMEGWMAYSGFSRKYSHLYHTEDGGLNWTELEIPIPEAMDLNDILFTDNKEGFVAAGDWCDTTGCHAGNALLYTTDGGQSWEFLKHDPHEPYMFYALDYDETRGYVAGGGYGIGEGRIFKLQNEAVNLPDVEKKELVRIFPNPAQSYFYIDTPDSYLPSIHIYIYDMKGQLIDCQAYVQNQDKIDISNLHSGIYILKVEMDKEVLFQKLMVK